MLLPGQTFEQASEHGQMGFVIDDKLRTSLMMAHSSQTRIVGKVDGQFLHAR